jgi:PleD family two-component response regulator
MAAREPTVGSYEILLIEDDCVDEEFIRRCLVNATHRFTLTAKRCLQMGIDVLRQRAFDAVLLDLSLPDSYGIGTVRRVLEEFRHLPIIVLSGLDDQELAREAVREGVQDYLVKDGISSGALSRSIIYAIERCRAVQTLDSPAPQS